MEKLRAAARRVADGMARWGPMLSRPPIPRPAAAGTDERGQGLAEYALILAGIAIVAIVSLAFLGETITNLFWAPIDDEFGKILSGILGP